MVSLLQVVTQSIECIDEMIDILTLHPRVGDDVPEKVRDLPQGLIADHEGAVIHHGVLQAGGHLTFID